MVHLIDKDALVAEINRLDELYHLSKNTGGQAFIESLISFLDTLEVKEQDLELTWKDMMIIHKCIKDAMNFKLYKMMEGLEGQKEVYEEVLKRFKAQRGK